jgi:ParB family transcriptional regulator, chromosome partitioning protein
MPFEFQQQPAYEALARLFEVAKRDTGQSRRVADFLLAWHNAEENKGWNPVDLWNVDDAIADDMISVLGLIRQTHRYPDDLGFGEEMRAVWKSWR